jgi:hypothetical protein
MLFGSALKSIPTSFERSRKTIQHQNTAVGLSRSCYHVGYKISVPRSVKYSKVTIRCCEKLCCHFNSYATALLLFSLVHDVSKLKARLAIFLGLFFIPAQL